MSGTLPYSSNLLCFFKCCAHLEDSESLRVLQLLDCHGIKTAQDLEACYSNSPDVVIRCFGTAGLETETISHIITCIENIAASGVLTTPLFVKTAGGHRQAPGVGLDIDTPCSKLPSRCDTGENTPCLDDEFACLRATDATQKTKVTSCPERCVTDCFHVFDACPVQKQAPLNFLPTTLELDGDARLSGISSMKKNRKCTVLPRMPFTTYLAWQTLGST